ncbi:MAG: LPS export ABC transporter periplasmic protein LptC [bacterium]
MRRLLLLLVIFLIGLGIIAAIKGLRDKAPLSTVPTSEIASPEMEITKFHLVETIKGIKRWKIEAAQAQVYENQTRMEGIETEFFSEQGDSITLSMKANQGVLDTIHRDISASGQVVVTDAEGGILHTQSLNWRAKEKILSTPDTFVFTQEGLTVTGQGVVVDQQTEKLKIKQDLKAEKEEGPLTITAKEALWNKREQAVFLKGEVKIVYKETIINADLVDGYGELNNLKKIIGRGKVKIVDTKEETTITGGYLEYLQATEYTLITANKGEKVKLEVKADTITVTAAKMERYLKENRSVATGAVEIKGEDLFASCGRATYYEDEEKIVLEGEPQLIQIKEGNRFQGEEIIYYTEDERIKIIGGVEATLFPKK